MNKIYLPPNEIDIPQFDPKIGFNEYIKKEDDFIKKVIQYAKENGEGEHRGRIASFPMGDGNAMYIIFDEKRKHLIHLPIGDCWESPLALYMPMKEICRKSTEYKKSIFA